MGTYAGDTNSHTHFESIACPTSSTTYFADLVADKYGVKCAAFSVFSEKFRMFRCKYCRSCCRCLAAESSRGLLCYCTMDARHTQLTSRAGLPTVESSELRRGKKPTGFRVMLWPHSENARSSRRKRRSLTKPRQLLTRKHIHHATAADSGLHRDVAGVG